MSLKETQPWMYEKLLYDKDDISYQQGKEPVMEWFYDN